MESSWKLIVSRNCRIPSSLLRSETGETHLSTLLAIANLTIAFAISPFLQFPFSSVPTKLCRRFKPSPTMAIFSLRAERSTSGIVEGSPSRAVAKTVWQSSSVRSERMASRDFVVVLGMI